MSVAYDIYELKKEIELFEEMMELIGEDDAEVRVKYEELKTKLITQIDSIPKIINHYNDIIDNLKIEEGRIKEYKTMITNKVDTFKKVLIGLVNDNGGKRLKGDIHTIFITKRKSKVYNEEEISETYYVEKTSKVLDKKAIIADMKEGVEVDGVTEVVKDSLTVK